MFLMAKAPKSDADRTIQEIVESRGFVFEEHKVITKDGYILMIHRVVNPYRSYDQDYVYKKPVLLQHGFKCSSTQWLIGAGDGHLNDKEYDEEGNRCISSNLGFALAKHRDGNFRGNTFSCKHKTLSAKDPQFWNFSLDEHIDDDLPSTIDYILDVTKEKNLAFVGHSQGNLVMFGLLSTKLEYNKIIKPFIALAPIVQLNHMRSPTRHTFKYLYPITSRITGKAVLIDFIKPIIPGHMFDNLSQRFVHMLVFMLGGFNWSQVDKTRLSVYHSHPFCGFSFKNLNHLLQMYLNGQFCKFNYDETIEHIDDPSHHLGDKSGIVSKEVKEAKLSHNQLLYNSKSPPIYDIKKITNEFICLFHGVNDWFTADEDLDFIRQKLKIPLYENHRVTHDDWNHLDFIYGKDCGHFVNSRVIDLIIKITKI